MKIPFLTILLGMNCCIALAQNNDTTPDKSNEIRLNGLFLIAGLLEMEYEHLINEESGIGISGLVALENSDYNWSISPYYRFYFGKKPAAGFFMEGFLSLNNTDDFVVENDTTEFQENITDLAAGISIGGKFLTRKGITAEISLGVGRNLFVTDIRDYEFLLRSGIDIGFRF